MGILREYGAMAVEQAQAKQQQAGKKASRPMGGAQSRRASGKADATAARGASQRAEDRQGIGPGQTGAASQKRKTQTLLAN